MREKVTRKQQKRKKMASYCDINKKTLSKLVSMGSVR
jgi:hypothetical protein